MIGYVIIAFLVMLGVLMLAISSGLRFFESKRRRQLVSVLRTVTESDDAPINLLMEPGDSATESTDRLTVEAIRSYLSKVLAESGLPWTVNRLLTLSGAAFLAGATLGLALPIDFPVVLRALLTGAILAMLPLMYVRRTRARRIGEMETQLPDALDFLARSMRAGHAFTISLEMVGEEVHDPLGQEFRTLFNEQNLGASLERSLLNFAERVPLGDVRFFSSAVLLQRQTGGNLSEVLGRLSHIIRERFRLKGQVKATSAHGRLTATILTLLPIATLVGLVICSPGYLDPLMHDPTGRKLLMTGVICQIVGNFFIRKIIRIKV